MPGRSYRSRGPAPGRTARPPQGEQGSVVCGLTGTRLPYGALLTGTRRVEVLAEEPPLTSPAEWTTAGRPYAGTQGEAVTGTRRFVSDLRRPGLRHGAVLRPPAPGRALRSVDTAAAEAMPGVTVVRDGEFIGVTAGDPGTARRAVAAIKADWDEPPPGPADLEAYLRAHPADGEGWQRAVSSEAGDPEAALAAAVIGVQATYTTAYLAHVPLETRAAVAEWEDGRLTVLDGHQCPVRRPGPAQRGRSGSARPRSG